MAARGKNITIRGENSHLLSARGPGRMADAEGDHRRFKLAETERMM